MFWQVEMAEGEVLYVGQTADNASPHASAPDACMSKRSEGSRNRKAMRKHLLSRTAGREGCAAFRQTR